MVSVCTRKVLTLSLTLASAAPDARASSDTCDRSDSVDAATLHASRSYHPPRFDDGSRTLARPSWFFVPLAAPVLSGQSGPFLASLSWRDAHGGLGACLYEGTGHDVRSGTCSGNGDEYRLGLCALVESSGISFFGAGGLIREATSIRFHILGGDSCAPTVAQVELTSPPDRDGDGIPDCLEGSTDRSSPTWPAGSALTATRSGGSVDLQWTSATDNVAVTGYRVFEDGTLVDEVNGSTLSAHVGSVTANTSHLFRIEAFDAAGNQSADGPTATVLIDTQPPTWPPGATLSISAVGLSAATLAWPAASDAIGVLAYRIYEDGALLGSTSLQTFDASNLDPSHSYLFVVQAVDAAGNESSDGPSATLKLDTSPPSWPPASVVAASISSGIATLMWTPATDNVGVTAYLVYQDAALVNTVSGSSLTATITGLAPNVSYQFQIQAVDAAGNASIDGPAVLAVEDTLAPTWPAGAALTATPASLMSANLSWTPAADNEGVTGYRVFANGLPVAQTDGSALSTAITGLDPSIVYVFRVQAFDAAGNTSTDGPQAQLRLDVTPPSWPPGSTLAASIAGATVTLAWSQANDDVGVAQYLVYENGSLVAMVNGSTLTAALSAPSAGTFVTFQVQAADAAGNATTDGPIAQLHIDVTPPVWPAGSTLTAAPTGARTVRLDWSAATDDSGVSGYEVLEGGIVVKITDAATRTATIAGLDPDTTVGFEIEAVDTAGNVSTGGPTAQVRIGVPDPVLVAPPIDPTVSTPFADAVSFLYTGPDAIQKDVAAGTIQRNRVAVIRGRTLDRNGTPVHDVLVTVLRHPELGHTSTRTDGMFDLVVNGGGELTVVYTHPDYLAVERRITPDWERTSTLPDVVLVARDPMATDVNFDEAATQVARASEESDEDGVRRVTLIVPSGTTATMVFGDGSQLPLESGHVRATERTVGPTGPQSLPAELPRASANMYAVALTVDEAEAAGAETVTFSQPVVAYVENFLDLPVGATVPSGFYDPKAGSWIAAANGQVVGIVGNVGGLAAIDTDGDDVADPPATLAALGITDAERAELALLYDAGQSLWRVPVSHFSEYGWCIDTSVPVGDGVPPSDDPEIDPEDEDPQCRSGSIVECENQSLGEAIPIAGTAMSLNYSSLRARSRASERTIRIPLTGQAVPNGVLRVHLQVDVAGQHEEDTFPALPNQTTSFTWNGRDVYGREILGSASARVRIGYFYKQRYTSSHHFGWFPDVSGYIRQGRLSDEVEILLDRSFEIRRPLAATPQNSFGGWTINLHQRLDLEDMIVTPGDGGHGRRFYGLGEQLETVGGPDFSEKLVVGPDGSFYHAQSGGFAPWVKKTTPAGQTTFFAGSTVPGTNGDGGPATAAHLLWVMGYVLGPDGSMYIVDQCRVRRVTPDGIIQTVAGQILCFGTSPGGRGDDGPALQALLDTGRGITNDTPNGRGIALLSDGTIVLGESDRVRRVGTDGIIGTLAAGFREIHEIAVGPDDSVYVLSETLNPVTLPTGTELWRLTPQGGRTKIAGTGGYAIDGNYGPALQARMVGQALAVARDGTIYVSEFSPFNGFVGPENVVRKIDADGILRPIAGTGVCNAGRSGTGFALQAGLCSPKELAIGPDNALYIDDSAIRFLRIASRKRWADENGFTLPASLSSADPTGDVVYVFDEKGRHVRTRDVLTGGTLETFDYTPGNRLSRIVDGNGNAVVFDYLSDGATLITAPNGQKTFLAYNGDGYLETVTDPSGAEVRLTYDRTDLLASFAHPLLGTSQFSYDAAGRLSRDTGPAGEFQNYVVSPISDGRIIHRTTRSGHDEDLQLRFPRNGGTERRDTDALGKTQTISRDTAGNIVTLAPDGSRSDVLMGPDAQLGLDAEAPVSSKVTLPSGRSLRMTYSESVTLANPLDPLNVQNLTMVAQVNGGRKTTTQYTGATRRITTTTAAGRLLVSTVDALGHPVDTFSPGVLPIHTEYDAQGRPTSMTQGARVASIAYDPAGRIGTVIAPGGQETSFTYDAASRPLTVTRADGSVLAFTYDATGRRVQIAPPGALVHVGEANPEAQTTDYTPPAVPAQDGRIHKQLDDEGLVAVATYGNGATAEAIVTVRDKAGRPITVSTPRGDFFFAYGADGNIQRLAGPDGVTMGFSFDGSLAVAATTDGPVTGVVEYGYDADLRLSSETVNGNVVAFAYDPDDLLTKAGALVLVRDAASGQITQEGLDSLTWTFARNGFGEIDHRAARLGAQMVWATDVEARDANGRVTAIDDAVGGQLQVFHYTYDVLGRLTDVEVDGALTAHYEYDENGNRLLEERDGLRLEARYDAQDRVTSYGSELFTYTPAGALESRTDDVTGATTSYDYDLGSSLLGVTLPSGHRVGYVIDPLGRRIARTFDGVFTHRWVYASDAGPAAEVDEAGNVVTRYVYGSRAWVPAYLERGGRRFALVTDPSGSVRLVVDSVSGEIVQTLTYDAFGRVLSDSNPGFQPFGYAGGLYDPATGLVRLGARDYDASLGRWTSKDPLLFGGGGSNLYAYAANDPIGIMDPTGLSWYGDLWLGMKTTVQHIVNGENDFLVDRIAGFGDALSGGITADIRSWMGTDNFVTPGSDYTSGVVLGTLWGFLTPTMRAASGLRGPGLLFAKAPGLGVVANLLRKIHGNSLKCTRPAKGYSLRDIDTGDVLKYGETTRGEQRYSKQYLKDNNARFEWEAEGTKQEMHDWQHDQILEYKANHNGERPPLNKSNY